MRTASATSSACCECSVGLIGVAMQIDQVTLIHPLRVSSLQTFIDTFIECSRDPDRTVTSGWNERFIRIRDASEVSDFSCERPLVQTLHVARGEHVDGAINENLEEVRDFVFTSSRVSRYGEIAATTTMMPLRESKSATKPSRRILVSRSSREKPSPCDRFVRTTSPSSSSTFASAPRNRATELVREPCALAGARHTCQPQRESFMIHSAHVTDVAEAFRPAVGHRCGLFAACRKADPGSRPGSRLCS